ncbi:MAG: SpoIIE family protein phosphatase, partial [Phycisphaerae bacterium]|nr:SpoIIE family protein phosphatase [Phycisphaerae bacterium]
GPGGEPGARVQRPFMPQVAVAFEQVDPQFGRDPNLDVSSDPLRTSEPGTEPNVPNSTLPRRDYQSQSCVVTSRSDEVRIRQAMDGLATLTPVYGEIYTQGPESVLWLNTSLALGVHTIYPGGVTPADPQQYEFFRRQWYDQAMMGFWSRRDAPEGRGPGGNDAGGPGAAPGAGRRGGRRAGLRSEQWRRFQIGLEAMQGAPTRDPFTGQMVLVRSMPVRYADGSFAGATAMVRTIHEIFATMQLPERWGTDIQRMLVLVDPNAVDPNGSPALWAQVLLHDGGEGLPSREGPPPEGGPRPGFGAPGMAARPGGPGPFERQLSEDTPDRRTLAALIDDIAQRRAGVRQVAYRGRECLLAYQPLDIPQVAALLVVPYEQVVGLSKTLEQSLLEQGWFWLQGTTLVLLVVGIVAVVLAALKARSVTNPIHALIEAGQRLGTGDYDARVEIATGDEFEHLGRVFNEAGPQLREREKMKRSLELAAAIQQGLLPDRPPSLEHLEIAGRCVYCDETGGDYYDFIDLHGTDGRRIGLASADVSGHGIGAALLMAATRGMLHADAEHHLRDLSSLLRGLNARLVRDAVAGQFMTLFYGILEDATRSLTWVSAGHEPAIWVHARSGRIEELPSTGLPLGVEPDADFDQAGPVILEPGDILAVGTDGIREARNQAGEFFGMERFLEILRDQAALPADQICAAVIDGVIQFVDPAPRTDDITLIVVKAKA